MLYFYGGNVTYYTILTTRHPRLYGSLDFCVNISGCWASLLPPSLLETAPPAIVI